METKPKTRFDYAAAHKEVIMPRMEDVKASPAYPIYLALRDAPEYAELVQDRDLLIPMSAGLRAQLEAIDTETLAYAARVLYFFGHWNSGPSAKEDKRGATWKFANLADQVLRERLGLPRLRPRTSIGYHFEIHEGLLRLCAETPESWTWREIAPATAIGLQRAQEWRSTLCGPPGSPYHRSKPGWQAFEQATYAALSKEKGSPFSPEDIPERWRGLFDVAERYMREEGKCSDDCPECGETFSHSIKCSKYPRKNRVDSLLRYGTDVYGFTTEEMQSVRDLLMQGKKD